MIHPVQRSEEEKEKVKIVAVDLQAMAPLPGVIQIQVGGPSSRQHHGSGTVGSAFFPRPEAASAFLTLNFNFLGKKYVDIATKTEKQKYFNIKHAYSYI